jgi:unsaturated rhamnogalacturonyl hydrolase
MLPSVRDDVTRLGGNGPPAPDERLRPSSARSLSRAPGAPECASSRRSHRACGGAHRSSSCRTLGFGHAVGGRCLNSYRRGDVQGGTSHNAPVREPGNSPHVGAVALMLVLAAGTAATAGCSSTTRSAVAESARASGPLRPDSALRAMTMVADWQLAHPSGAEPHDWSVAPFWAGLVSFAPLSATPARYFEAARANGRRSAWRPGPSPFLADDHAITQSYFMLYLVDRVREQIAPALARFDEMLRQPFNESLEFSHDTAEREWVWCDALFMSPPALVLATQVTGDRRYADLMNRLWWKTTGYLYDPREHLYYRDSRFFDLREKNGAKVFWSRGNGWVIAGLARVLQYLSTDYPERPRFVALFQDMARQIASLQPPDGYWRASLLDPGSWLAPETSGTALFTYALAWGVNEGLLDRGRYAPAVRRGWEALVQAIQPGGMLGYVQKPGDRPAETGPDQTEIYAAGALLLAGTQVYRLLKDDRAGAADPDAVAGVIEVLLPRAASAAGRHPRRSWPWHAPGGQG